MRITEGDTLRFAWSAFHSLHQVSTDNNCILDNAHLFIHSLPHTHQPMHPPTHPLTHSLTQPTHSLTQTTHSLTHPLTHPLTHSPTHPPTHSLTHSLTQPFRCPRNLLLHAILQLPLSSCGVILVLITVCLSLISLPEPTTSHVLCLVIAMLG